MNGLRNRARRGSLMYGLAAVLVVTGALVGVVMDRSAETYRRSVQLEARLRGTAAMEGAGRVITPREGSAPSELEVGATTVRFDAATRVGDVLRIPATALIRTREGRVFHEHQGTLEFADLGNSTWTFVGMAP